MLKLSPKPDVIQIQNENEDQLIHKCVVKYQFVTLCMKEMQSKFVTRQ